MITRLSVPVPLLITVRTLARSVESVHERGLLFSVLSRSLSRPVIRTWRQPAAIDRDMLKFHGSSFLVASSRHLGRHARRDTRATSSRGCYCWDVARVGRLPRSARHALTRLVGRRSAVMQCCARLSVCRVVLRLPRARHAQLVADLLARILVASSCDMSDTPDFLVTC